MRTTGLLLLASLSLAGCDRAAEAPSFAKPAAPPAQMADEAAVANFVSAPRRRSDSALAYEHTVTIELGAADIPARIDAMQQTCLAQSAGECEVLNVTQVGGEHPSGAVMVRVVPKGVDSLVEQAARDGEVAERTVEADDLAEAVADNALRRSRLEKEHARLLEFQERPSVKLGDMLKLSERMADVEAQLDQANQQSAQQRRRIDKELLTMRFRPMGVEVGGSAIGDAMGDSLEIAGASTAWLIRAVAAALPALAALLCAWMLWRTIRRRGTVRAKP